MAEWRGSIWVLGHPQRSSTKKLLAVFNVGSEHAKAGFSHLPFFWILFLLLVTIETNSTWLGSLDFWGSWKCKQLISRNFNERGTFSVLVGRNFKFLRQKFFLGRVLGSNWIKFEILDCNISCRGRCRWITPPALLEKLGRLKFSGFFLGKINSFKVPELNQNLI